MATTYLQELAASYSQQKTNKFRTSVTDAWTVRQPGARSDHTVLAAVLVDNMANERTAHAISEAVALRIRVALDDASPSAAVLSPADRAERALKAANYDLFYRAANENKRETLGASVMVALLTKTGEQVTLQLLHVGNGRAYLMRGAELRPLTTEHTARQAQRELDPHANARDDDPRWDRPLRYLGAEAEVTIERTAPFAIEREDRIILVAAQVRPTVVKQTAEMMRRRTSNAAVNALIKQAAAYRPADPLTTPPITDCAAVVIARRTSANRTWIGILLLLMVIGLVIAASNGGFITRLRGLINEWMMPTPLLTATATATATPTPSPMITGSPTPSATPTPQPTATMPPTVTPTVTKPTPPSPTPTLVAIYTRPPATATPTHTLTPIATATGTATPTPAPVLIEETATLTTTPTGEQAPPVVPTPTITALSTPGNTVTATELAPLAPLPGGFVIKLGAPEADYTAIGRTEFTWSASANLPDGYELELIFWRRGEDPIQHGRGYGGRSRNLSAVVNFEKLGLRGEEMGEYFWGVRLLQVGSEQPLGPYWGERRIVIHSPSEPSPTRQCTVEPCGG